MPKIDEKFNEIVLKDMKNLISIAFNDLSANLRHRSMRQMSEESLRLIEKKACQMKSEVTDFIDMQVKGIEESIIRVPTSEMNQKEEVKMLKFLKKRKTEITIVIKTDAETMFGKEGIQKITEKIEKQTKGYHHVKIIFK